MGFFVSKDRPDEVVEAVLWDGEKFSEEPQWLKDAIERKQIVQNKRRLNLNQPEVANIAHTQKAFANDMLWRITERDGRDFFYPMAQSTWGLLYEPKE